MACSYENEGVFNPSKSRIRVFDFHEEARFVPYTCTQCDEAWCQQACPTNAITTDANGVKIVSDSLCVGCKVYDRLPVRHRQLQRLDRQGHQVRLVRWQPGLRRCLPDGGDHLSGCRADRLRQDEAVGDEDRRRGRSRRAQHAGLIGGLIVGLILS